MSRPDERVYATIGTEPFVCTVCKSAWFKYQEVYLGAKYQLDNLNMPSATGLVCTVCGYLHLFDGAHVRMWGPDGQSRWPSL